MGALAVRRWAFSRVAWPTFGVLLLTGGWNIAAESDEMTGSYRPP